MLISVKMNNSNGFAACYYVGDLVEKTVNGDLVLNDPLRFLEVFIPVDDNGVSRIKTEQKQIQHKPTAQYASEPGLSSSQLIISKYQFQTYGEIEELNKDLVIAYYQVLESRKDELKPKVDKQANLEAV